MNAGRYLLCIECRRAWFALDGDPVRCDICDAVSVVCSPWGSADTWEWYKLRTKAKAVGIFEVLAVDVRLKRHMLARGIRRRGRELCIARAA